MPEVKFADPGGDEITLLDFGEDYYVPNFENADAMDAYLPTITNMTFQDDDIFLCNYAKSGLYSTGSI
jgi:hypothetical protein